MCFIGVQREAQFLKGGGAIFGLALWAGSLAVGSAHANDAYKISFVGPVKGEAFFTHMYCGAESEAKRAGATISFTAGDHFDPREQTSIFNAITAQRPDAALVVPVDTRAMIPALRQMRDAGIQIAEVDTHVDDASIAVAQIATDNYQGGALAAQKLAALVNDVGMVLVVNVQPGISSVDARQKGFLEEMKGHPKITVLPVEFAGFDASKAAAVTTAALSAHPEIAGIYDTVSILGEGTVTGLQQMNKVGAVKIVAFDPTPGVVAAFDRGIIDVIIAQDAFEIGVKGVQAVVNALEKKPTKRSIAISAVAIDHQNVASMKRYYYRDRCD
ncbi:MULTISPECIES: ABC transporter substrate-binding protein [unclassified Bradyrhizobium]|uniref:ABC transporter substrate-binding protein n=1 Tax=unclassified Bradyrhizobium TaxID=2631580 RepID=UPI001FF9E1A0|nr:MULTISPECIES: ABC transporter substrate-binding protein [unclassified Bradyrhizobium]MCK1708065.1 substrate-binding domain-containing protein [Bradyrhizobium sp. 143]MCK1731426.1 substrate-binding domain-containing protein [Bradyrhizobium sp. 142]